MKVIKITGLVILFTLIVTRLVAQNQIHVKLTNPTKPYKLNVELTIGTIKVSTYEGKEIIIDADVPTAQQKKIEEIRR